LRAFLLAIGFHKTTSTTLLCDNNASIHVSDNPKDHVNRVWKVQFSSVLPVFWRTMNWTWVSVLPLARTLNWTMGSGSQRSSSRFNHCWTENRTFRKGKEV
jgi:hypothetical protein